MVGELLYAFRIMRLPLLDAGGQAIGKINDIIVVAGRGAEAPKVLDSEVLPSLRVFLRVMKMSLPVQWSMLEMMCAFSSCDDNCLVD